MADNGMVSCPWAATGNYWKWKLQCPLLVGASTRPRMSCAVGIPIAMAPKLTTQRYECVGKHQESETSSNIVGIILRVIWIISWIMMASWQLTTSNSDCHMNIKNVLTIKHSIGKTAWLVDNGQWLADLGSFRRKHPKTKLAHRIGTKRQIARRLNK